MEGSVLRLLFTGENEIIWVSFRLGYELQLAHTTHDMFALYIYLIYIFLDLIIFSVKIALKNLRKKVTGLADIYADIHADIYKIFS